MPQVRTSALNIVLHVLSVDDPGVKAFLAREENYGSFFDQLSRLMQDAYSQILWRVRGSAAHAGWCVNFCWCWCCSLFYYYCCYSCYYVYIVLVIIFFSIVVIILVMISSLFQHVSPISLDPAVAGIHRLVFPAQAGTSTAPCTRQEAKRTV